MGLAEVQRLMARLATDDELREQFFDDPAAVGGDFELTPGELRQVEQLSVRQLSFFAASLRHKRLRGVGKLLPLTRQALGGQFDELFRRHAAAYAPSGVRKHRDDALAFAAFVEAQARLAPLDPPGALDQLRYEIAWLLAAESGRRCLVRRFANPIRARARLGDGAGPDATRSAPSVGIWLRLTPEGRLYHVTWSGWPALVGRPRPSAG